MARELSDYQKKTEARTIVDNLALDNELTNLESVLDKLFADAEPEVREATSRTEVESLISEIKKGTANHTNIARFLELAGELSIS